MRILCVLLAVACSSAFAGKVSPTLGVDYRRQPLYMNKEEFQCLDGTKIIPANQINDDYCDCPDGSDEPGTSACPQAVFFCTNVGHEGYYIPSSRVNDGICDCCDGSDEYQSNSCQNICDELGRSAREERERKATVARNGFKIRQEKALEAQKLKKEKEESVIPLRAEKDSLQPQKQELERIKKEAEDREKALTDAHRDKWIAEKFEKKKSAALGWFVDLDKNEDSQVSVAELQQLPYLDSDLDGKVTEEEAKHFLGDVDAVDFSTFTSTVFDNLKQSKKTHEADKKERSSDDLVADEDKVEDLSQDEEDNDDDTMPPHDEETQHAIEAADSARKAFTDMEIKVNTLESQIREAETFLNEDYGSDLAWVALKGHCFELNDLQYIYKVCPFDKTIQKDKNGHGETNLGYWKSWNGQAPRKYTGQKYDEGLQCWNGPKRSTQVFIECGEQNELYEASEPAKCEYQFKFRTPMACNDPDKEEPMHTEL
ncbi:unnamed protein product [Auanema sp. JU1783]|nr:unnamed protein product [Auanema sp. JU1783]